MRLSAALPALLAATTHVFADSYSTPGYRSSIVQPELSIFGGAPPECPPCFNCNLGDFQCHQFSNCSAASGRCICPPGWGGDDCSDPLCGSLSDGKDRLPRKGEECDCHDGWSGINCNVCKTNDVCNSMTSSGEGGVCYKGGLVVRENYQQCDVTNKQILDQLKGQKPQVTFSCEKEDAICNFQCKPQSEGH
jgi:hypothetical protein